MGGGMVHVCRLCLKEQNGNCEEIGDYQRGIFEILLLNLKLAGSEKSFMCTSCTKHVQDAFEFKSSCFSTEEQVLSFAVENVTPIDLKLLYKSKRKGTVTINHGVCCFCLKCLENSHYVSLEDTKEKGVVTEEMLTRLLPEIDYKMIRDPLICASCVGSLKSYFDLVISCEKTEEKIRKSGHQVIDNKSTMDLNNVTNFFCEDDTKYDITHVTAIIKKEEPFIEDIVNQETVEEIIVKHEPLDTATVDNPESSVPTDLVTKQNPQVEYYKCKWCEYKSKCKGHINRHAVIHKDITTVKIYTCEKCRFQTRHRDSLKKHFLVHRDKLLNDNDQHLNKKSSPSTLEECTVYTCAICKYMTTRRTDFKTHIVIHKDHFEVEVYKCETCGFQTKHKRNMNAHIVVHKKKSEVKLYKCDECEYKTKYNRSLKKHLVIHKDKSEIEMYKCGLCKFQTKHKESLRQHILRHEGNLKSGIYRCKMCRFQTKQRASLQRHILLHDEAL